MFHRPAASIRLTLLVSWLKLRKVAFIAEFDDLVFDTAYCEFSPGILNNVLGLEQTKKKYRAHQRALKLFERFSVSTEPLRDHLLKLDFQKQVAVLPNAPHHHWRKQFDHLPVPEVNWSNPVITYLPGTKSHDRDFQVFTRGIADFLNDHPYVRLQVTGPLQFELDVNPAQIIRREKVPFREYHQHISHGWVNLAPLEDTPFTRCKSALKVMEAGYWGRPTLCSPIPDAERFIGNGAIPVNSTDELYAELQKLLEPVYYYNYTKDLRKRVLELADIHQVAEQLIDFVSERTAEVK
ncbi:MAG: glycosyltransferase [Thiolinea sp.]